MNLFTVHDVVKQYGEGSAKVIALDHVTLTIPQHKLVVILGASGSGKSTLLNLLGCMDRPTSGAIRFLDQDITGFTTGQMTRFRGENIGFVFQSYNLLPDLTAVENVEFSTELAGLPRRAAADALAQVGLADRLDHYPSELSGGEQQRVSIARAIAKDPQVLLCDEPTGALDFRTGVMVLEVLSRIRQQGRTSILLITHNQEIAKIADLVITLRSGRVAAVTDNPAPLTPAEVTW